MGGTLAVVTLVLSLLTPEWACADHAYRDCPRSCYSCVHYWAPTLYKINYCFHGRRMNTYAPDRHPEIEPSFKMVRFPCPPVNAQAASVDFYYSR
jgi:hypothetical protein